MFLEYSQRITQYRLFNRDESPQTIWQVIAWWESRRIPYNLIVGSAGVISCILCLVTGLITETYLGEPIGIPDPPFLAILAVLFYGVMANICYTGGWMAELIVRWVWREKGKYFGPISFTLGLAFSIILTLLPGILISIIGFIALLGHAFGFKSFMSAG